MKMQVARGSRGPLFYVRRLQTEADVLEYVAQVAQLLAASGRSLREGIEDLSILQPVICEPRDTPLLVEVDCDHALIGHFIRHESGRTLGLLRDVIEGIATDRGDG